MSTENAAATGSVVQTSTPASTPASPAQSAQAASQGTQAPEVSAAASGAGGTEAPAYTPNFKFKVYDEEKEFDEMFRGLVKDAETEKKIREFHEKAFGLDHVKPKHEKLKADFSEVQTKYTNIDKSLKQLSSMLKAGDMASFFDVLNIPDAMVYDYVKRKLELQQAPPEQRAAYEEQERIRRENFTLQQQNEELMSRYQSETTQARAFELDQALAGPDISKIAFAYDSKMGRGAFRDEVINRGVMLSRMSGREMTVPEVLEQVVGIYSKLLPDQGAVSSVAQPQAGAPAAKAPTIPNVSGSSASPIKKGPRSIEDIKKAAARFST